MDAEENTVSFTVSGLKAVPRTLRQPLCSCGWAGEWTEDTGDLDFEHDCTLGPEDLHLHGYGTWVRE